MKRLVLIDGNSLIHRAYHALPPLHAPDGTPVNAVYGFTMMLLRVLQELKPEYIAMTFDMPGPTFRHTQYVGYKANRPKVDSDLVPQFQIIREMTSAFNIPIFSIEGYEADDLVGTLAKQAKVVKDDSDDLETIIVSGDLDTLQLVDEQTKVFTPRKGISDTILYDIAQVKERFGFEPIKLIDYKGLKGDTSDNIPGVPGIGDKTAITLIQQYESLEGVLANVIFLKGKLKESLIEYAEQAKMSKELATIDTQAPITLHLKDTVVHDFDRKKVLEMFQRLGFRSLVNRLNEVFPGTEGKMQAEDIEGEEVEVEDKTNVSYKIISDPKDVEALVAQLNKVGMFAFDTETTSLKPIEATLVGTSYAYRTGEAFYIPYSEETLAILKPLLENPKIKKIGHNMKFDALVLENHGVQMKGFHFDTLLAAWLLAKGAFTSIGLKNIVYQELGIQMQEITELIGTGKKQISMSEVPIDEVANYACADADMAFRLKVSLERKLRANKLVQVFENYEMPLIEVLQKMERNGVLVDCDFLTEMSEMVTVDLEKITKEIYDSVGHEFNINSPKQLADILFNELHLPTATKTKTGFSTDESVLSSLKGAHPVIAYLLQYRMLNKLKSTYIDALPILVDKENRLHTNFNQTGASSGRLSSTDPNLQNIPIKTELGAQIRKAFIAPKGSVIVSADYSQIELRILAHLSGDPVLVKAFKSGDDVHTLSASVIYGVPENNVTKEQRRVGKTINFALMYGMSAFGLSQSLGISRSDAAAFIERFFLTYAKVKEFLDSVIQRAYQDGYVETISGRKRYIPELQSHVPMMRRAGERMAINLPMQGTNADIIKLAMAEIHHDLAYNQYKTKMILQVHDELVFEVPEEELAIVAPRIKKFMTNAYHLSVPIVVEQKYGPSWGETQPLTIY